MFSFYDFFRAQIETKQLTIEPFDKKMVQPASIDVRLDNRFQVFNNHLYDSIDPSIEQEGLTSEYVTDWDTPFILHPGEFVLASTIETVGLSNILAARLEGKSSLGRLGLLVHSTAGFIDPGFKGHITLELSNVANLPIKLWPGMKIGQICVFRLNSVSPVGYGDATLGSRYQHQRGPTPSRAWKNFYRMPRRDENGEG